MFTWHKQEHIPYSEIWWKILEIFKFYRPPHLHYSIHRLNMLSIVSGVHRSNRRLLCSRWWDCVRWKRHLSLKSESFHWKTLNKRTLHCSQINLVFLWHTFHHLCAQYNYSYECYQRHWSGPEVQKPFLYRLWILSWILENRTILNIGQTTDCCVHVDGTVSDGRAITI